MRRSNRDQGENMNETSSARRRVVQWTTGNVGRQAVAAIVTHPDLELVGVFAHDPAKAGRDAAELCGLDEPTGVVATGDVDALLALRPDCVVYTALHLDADEVARILRAGINVVTTSEFLTGTGIGADATATIDEAARAGDATILGTGVNPGFAELFAAISAGISRDVRSITLTESADVTMFANDPNFEAVGWGRPQDDPGHAEAVEAATIVFADGLDVLAALVGLTLDDRRCTVTFAHATEELDIPGMVIPKGHVGGMDVCWDGLVGGTTRLTIRQRWVIGDRIEPTWPVEFGYVVEVDGDPNLRIKLDLWPDGDLAAMDVDDFRALGMRITAVPAVNAIPAVCAAPSGIRTYAELPVITTHMS
jgi:2,4-diaminopentanoate dehydrogenase